MHLDHVSYATSPGSFVPTLQRIGSQLGASFTDGGVHPRFGTRNVVLACARGTYVEVVTTLDHPAADRAPFGQAVSRRAAEGGGWLGWVVSVDDIAPIEQRLGRPSVPGHRVLPTGEELSWRQIGVLDLLRDPQLPFFVCWDRASRHPATGAPGTIRLSSLEIAGAPDAVDDWLGESVAAAMDDVSVEWIDDDDPGLAAVHFQTASGSVRID